MKPKIGENEWLGDFQEFLNSKKGNVPQSVSKNILKRIQTSLNPSWHSIFLKLFGIHVVTGTLSLAICSQFDMNPFNSGFSLTEYFMKFGHSACNVLCGIIFVGGSFLVAASLLRAEELRVLRKNALIQSFGLSLLSLGVFWFLASNMEFGLSLLWLLGAVLGGVGLSELVYRWRLARDLTVI